MSNATDSPSALEVADKLASRLEFLGADYAIGGALALAFWINLWSARPTIGSMG